MTAYFNLFRAHLSQRRKDGNFNEQIRNFFRLDRVEARVLKSCAESAFPNRAV